MTKPVQTPKQKAAAKAARKAWATLREHGVHADDLGELLGVTALQIRGGAGTWGWKRTGTDIYELSSVMPGLHAAFLIQRQTKKTEPNDLKLHQARLARIRADLAEGSVMRREDAEMEAGRVLMALRRRLRNLPGTLAAKAMGTTPEQMETLRAEVDEILTDAHAEVTSPLPPSEGDPLAQPEDYDGPGFDARIARTDDNADEPDA